MKDQGNAGTDSFDVAVVGLAGRFPGADDVDAFWNNLKAGVESIARFSDEELLEAGVPPTLVARPEYVKAKGVLNDIEWFAAEFFGFTAREASALDPQHRLFIECVWHALESAGYDPLRLPGVAALYAGAGAGGYLLDRRTMWADENGFEHLIGNEKDYLATRTAYKFNFGGPCIGVQTACSTSLVAIHLACQSLINYECDVALAGGSSINVPAKHGYLHQEGMIFSPDGHCRPFDAQAQGTVFGSGVGVVVLRRLEDALKAGDCIRAVIKGSAVNNDGVQKIGFTAPGVEGQAKVIAAALAMADVDPATVGLIEAHGTGTPLGDPIEIDALTRVFGETGRNRCAIGSVKSNVGHLEVAAGVAGFIKAVLQLEHRQLVPSLHFNSPNPRIDFARGPFYVNTELREWPQQEHTRRAGVSSFGIGGTNAHVVLEEAPSVAGEPACRAAQLIVLSAKTPEALDASARRIGNWLREHAGADLADVAWTLQAGRSAFEYRRAVVARTASEATEMLGEAGAARSHSGRASASAEVVFMFPGQGAQYAGMARELYAGEPVFRRVVDDCVRILGPHLDVGLLDVLFSAREDAAARLQDTAIAQPALFVVEYALARLLQSWGVQPAAMIGHSVGEWVAACIAGVFSLEDALELVAARGRLMQGLPPGAMLAVGLAEADLLTQLPPGLDIAARNAPEMLVVSGPADKVEAFERTLNGRFVSCRRLHTSHAFHSAMMEPVVADFQAMVARKARQAPQVRYVSNVTGAWIAAEEATDPAYWARHLRQCVHFDAGLGTLLSSISAPLLLEVGPGATLGVLAQQGRVPVVPERVLATLPRRADLGSETEFLLRHAGRLWVAGVPLDWRAFHGPEQRRRVALPGYVFERKRYWIERPAVSPGAMGGVQGEDSGHPLLGRRLDLAAGHWYTGELSAAQPWFVEQHRVLGAPVFPGAAFVEWMLAAARATRAEYGAALVLEDVSFGVPLGIADDGMVATQTNVDLSGDGVKVRCFARRASEVTAGWVEHASGRVGDAAPATPPHATPAQLQSGMQPRPVDQLYDGLRELGVDYGDAFRAVKQLWRSESHGLARIEVPQAAADGERYGLHPVVLDACLHCIAGMLDGGANSLELPVGIDRLTVYGRTGQAIWCRVNSTTGLTHDGDSRVDLDLFDEQGRCVAQLQGLRFKPVAESAGIGARPKLEIYRTEWQLVEEQAPATADAGEPWLLFCPEPSECLAWREALQRMGHSVVSVEQGAGFDRSGNASFTVDFHSEQSVAQLFSLLRADHPGFSHVLMQGAGAPSTAARRSGGLAKLATALFSRKTASNASGTQAGASVPDEVYATAQSAFLFLKHFFASYPEAPSNVVVVTRGGYEPDWRVEQADTEGLRSAVMAGLAKALLAEFPNVRCVQVDLDPSTTSADAEAVLARALAVPGSGHLALRGGDCFEARLERMSLPADVSGSVPVKADATYLVTGGWGGLGFAAADWLVQQGARYLVLTGRTLPGDPARIDSLRQRGAKVELEAVDVSDAQATRSLFERIAQTMPPLRGVLHAAGSNDDDLLTQLDWPRFARVLDAKVRGAWNLHEYAGQLDFLVFFSSSASLIGAAGQSNYVVANSVLDAIAHYRRLNGLPALAINWGTWADTGMAARQGMVERSNRLGIDGIRTSEGTASLARLLSARNGVPPQVGVIRADWQRLALVAQGRTPYRMLSALVAAGASGTAGGAFGKLDFSGLADMAPDAAQAMFLERLLAHVSLALGLDGAEQLALKPRFAATALNELGLDSLMAIQMRQRLMRDLDVHIPLQQVMGNTTAGEMAEAFYQQKLFQQLKGSDADATGEDMETELL